MIGVIVLTASWSYDVGSLKRMGPGYFPMLLGGTLCILSIPILLAGLASSLRTTATEVERLPGAHRNTFWRPLVLIPLSILLFALLLKQVGLAPAAFASAILAGLAERSNNKGAIILVAAATAVFTSIVFVFIFGIPMKLVAV